MKKKIMFIGLICITFCGLSMAGYTWLNKPVQTFEKTEKPKVASADKFALEQLILLLRKYQHAQTINAEFTTTLMAADGKTVLNSFDGRYVKDSLNLFVKSFGSENLLTGNYLVAVDDDEQMIFVEKPEFEKSKEFFDFGFLLDLDSLINLPDSFIFYEKLNESTAKLSLEIPSGNYYKTELIYNIASMELKKVRMYPYEELFEETPEEGEISDNMVSHIQTDFDVEERPLYVEFDYNLLEINKKLNKKWFDEKRYFVVKDNGLVLTNLYKNYEIDYE